MHSPTAKTLNHSFGAQNSFFKFCENLLPNLVEKYPSSPTAVAQRSRLVNLNSYDTRSARSISKDNFDVRSQFLKINERGRIEQFPGFYAEESLRKEPLEFKVRRTSTSPKQERMKEKNEDKQGEITNFEAGEEQELRPAVEQKSISCNCKKSSCLKFYCECLASDDFCGKNCNCENCQNIPEKNDIRQKVIESILTRNPKAFLRKKREENKLLQSAEDSKSAEDPRKLFGCNCKKSLCKKKYCECVLRGSRCTELCKCTSCHNKGVGKSKFVKKMKLESKENLMKGGGDQKKKALAYKSKINGLKSAADAKTNGSENLEKFHEPEVCTGQEISIRSEGREGRLEFSRGEADIQMIEDVYDEGRVDYKKLLSSPKTDSFNEKRASNYSLENDFQDSEIGIPLGAHKAHFDGRIDVFSGGRSLPTIGQTFKLVFDVDRKNLKYPGSFRVERLELTDISHINCEKIQELGKNLMRK